MSELAAFVSYSHRDDTFVTAVVRALEAEGRDVWVDEDDIPPGAPWRRELGTAIEAADAFVFVLSPDSVSSDECRRELARAAELGKRLVALDHRPVDDPPPEVRDIQWIRGSDGDIARITAEVIEAIDTDHEHVRAHTQWLARALRWSEHGHERSHLLRGRELRAAEEWLAGAAGHAPAPTALQGEYIGAGRRAERARRRGVIGALAVGLVIAIGLAVVAIIQRNTAERERRVAEARELAASSLLTLGEDPELSLILAERAARIDHNAQVEDALRQALLTSRKRLTLSGHPNPLTHVAYSPDGETIATVSQDGTGRVWDAKTGRTRAELRGHEASVSGLEFGTDGRWLITYAQDYTARVWDAETGESVAVLRDPDDYRLQDATLSPDGRHAATGQFVHGGLRIWDVASARTVRMLAAPTTNDVAFSPDGRLLLTTHQNFTARLWDLRTGAFRALRHGGRYVWSGVFSPDGQLVATAGSDGITHVWDVETGLERYALEGHRNDIGHVAWAPGGKLLLKVGGDRSVRVWNVATGRSRAVLTHETVVESAAFSRDGNLVVTTDTDGVARVWRSAGGQSVATLRGHRGPIREAAFGPGTLVVTAGADGTARVWDATPGSPAIVATGRQVLGKAVTQSTPEGHVLMSHDFPYAAGNACLVVRLPSDRDREPCRRVADRQVLAIDDRGRNVVSGLYALDGAATVDSTDTGTSVTTFADTASRHVDAASFGPDGRVVFATEAGTAEIWDPETGRRALSVRAADTEDTILGASVTTDAAFSPDGSRIVTASNDQSVRIFDAQTGRQLHRLEGLPPLVPRIEPIARAAFSPDGTRVVGSASWSELALVWDARTGRRTTELIGHLNPITSARFSPNGAFIITTDDTDARIWDAVSGRLLATFAAARSYYGPELATFLPDGHSIAMFVPTFERDGELVIYDCLACRSIDGLAALAAERITRPLSQAERAKYLHEG